MAHDWHQNLAGCLASIGDDPRFHVALRHGSMSVELYAPRGSDPQTPHRQDELYVIASGSGTFLKGKERVPFRPNDVLFVEAGMDHRFVDFTDDFSAWVIFWGPDGGEAE